jgi:AAA+ ATPase superfamily predicted ATPase
MLEGVRERKGITLITGEPGTGKTTLIHALLKDLSEKIKTAFVYHTTIEFPDLLKEILQDLGVRSRGNSIPELLVLFGQYLQERLAQDETVAVIIDEAQNLGFEAIRNLLGLSQREIPDSQAGSNRPVGADGTRNQTGFSGAQGPFKPDCHPAADSPPESQGMRGVHRSPPKGRRKQQRQDFYSGGH